MYSINDINPDEFQLSEYSMPKDEFFEIMNFKSTDFINETDTLFIMLLLTIMILILVLILRLPIYQDKWCRKYFKRQEDAFFWNGILRFLIESYLPLLIPTLLNIYNL